MAKIPEANFGSTQISTSVGALPYQSAEGEIAQIQAYSNLGQSVAKLGMDLGKMRQKVQQDAYISKVSADYTLASTLKREELKQKHAANPLALPEEEKEFNEKERIKAMADAPDDKTRADVDNWFTRNNANAFEYSYAEANKENALILDQQREENKETKRKALRINPTTKRMTQLAAEIVADDYKRVGSQLSQAKAMENEVNTYNELAADFVMTAVDSPSKYKMTQLRQVKKFLKGEDVDGMPVYSKMSADTLNALTKKVDNEIELETRISEASIKDDLADTIGALKAGRNVPADRIELAMSKASMSKDSAKQLDTLQVAKLFKDRLESLKKKTDGDLDVAAAQDFEIPDTDFNYEDRAALSKTFKEQAAKIKKDRNENPGQYAYDNFEQVKNLSHQAYNIEDPKSMQEFAKAVTAIQSHYKVKNSGILNDGIKDHYSTILLGSKDKDAAIQTIAEGYGDYAPRVMADLVSNKSGSQFTTTDLLIATLDSKADRKNLYAAKSNSKFYSHLDPEDVKEAKRLIPANKTLMAFKEAKAASGNSRPEDINALNELVELQTKANIDRNMAPKAAVEAAVNTVMGGTTIVQDRKTTIILNKTNKDFEKPIRKLIDYSANTEALRGLGVSLSDVAKEKIKAEGADYGGMINSEDKYLKMIASTGQWVASGAGDKVTLVYRDADENLVAATNKNGEAISVPVSQISTYLEAMGTTKREAGESRLRNRKMVLPLTL